MDMYVVYIYVSWIKAYLYSLGIFFFFVVYYRRRFFY